MHVNVKILFIYLFMAFKCMQTTPTRCLVKSVTGRIKLLSGHSAQHSLCSPEPRIRQ